MRSTHTCHNSDSSSPDPSSSDNAIVRTSDYALQLAKLCELRAPGFDFSTELTRIRTNLGALLLDHDQTDSALEHLRTAIAEWPDGYAPRELAYTRFMLADQIALCGDTSTAERYLAQAIPNLDKDPKATGHNSSTFAIIRLAEFLLDRGESKDAKDLLLALKAEDSRHFETNSPYDLRLMATLGEARYMEGEEQGLDELSRAYTLSLSKKPLMVEQVSYLLEVLLDAYQGPGREQQAFAVLNDLFSLSVEELKSFGPDLDTVCMYTLNLRAGLDRRSDLLSILGKIDQIYQDQSPGGDGIRWLALNTRFSLRVLDKDYDGALSDLKERFRITARNLYTHAAYRELWKDLAELRVLTGHFREENGLALFSQFEHLVDTELQGLPVERASCLLQLCDFYEVEEDESNPFDRMHRKIDSTLDSAPDDRVKTRVLYDLGMAYSDRKNVRYTLRASQILGQASELATRYFDSQSEIGGVYMSWALALHELGEPQQAERAAETGLEHLKASDPDEEKEMELCDGLTFLMHLSAKSGHAERVVERANQLVRLVESSSELAPERKATAIVNAISACEGVAKSDLALELISEHEDLIDSSCISLPHQLSYQYAKASLKLRADSGVEVYLDMSNNLLPEIETLIMELEEADEIDGNESHVFNAKTLLADICLELYRAGEDVSGELQSKLNDLIPELDQLVVKLEGSNLKREKKVTLLSLQAAYDTSQGNYESAQRRFEEAIRIARPYIARSLPIAAHIYHEYAAYFTQTGDPGQAKHYSDLAEAIDQASD